MVLSDNLYSICLNYYNKYSQLDFVVKPSLPILYFGNSGAYFKSNFKVITAALNPSDAEFKEFKNSNTSFIRFPQYENTIESLKLSLDNYFKTNPYKKWFGIPNKSNNGFLPLLNGLGTCYYEGTQKNVALHTDIFSPLATNPTWSKLNKVQKRKLSNEGFEIWKKLVIELKPDLILMSLKKESLKLLPIDFIKRIKTKKGKLPKNRKQLEFTIDHYKLNLGEFNTNLIWGSAQNTPLQPFSNKRALGKEILNYYINQLPIYCQ